MSDKEKLSAIENLELAFQRLKYSQRGPHKTLYKGTLKDFEPFRKDYFDIISEHIRDGNFIVKNNKVSRLYIPKKDGFVRPMTYLGFEYTLVYQAICNIIAQKFRPSLSLNYNKITFGHHLNSDFNNRFQFLPWKERWKRYQDVSKKIIESDEFNYVVDFDIASFFDSINHQLLIAALKEKLDSDVCDILLSVLTINHSCFSDIPSNLNTGIPQGPDCSTILSEVFLHKYIDKYFVKQIQKNEIKYIRYADDIRVFAQKETIAKKFITILDLLCRNVSLIPQTSKVGVTYYEKVSDFLDSSANKFSNIDKYYKKVGKLKAKENKKALELLKKMLKTKKIDKTKLNFYIYKVSKDDELKALILSSVEEKYEFIDPFLEYLNKHYRDDESVITQLCDMLLQGQSIFLDYPQYIFLNKFKDKLKFDSNLFHNLFSKNNHDVDQWLLKLALINWAEHWKQKDVISYLTHDNIDIPLLKRRLLYAKYNSVENSSIKFRLETELIKDQSNDLVFLGISLRHKRELFLGEYHDQNEEQLNNRYYDKALRNKSFSEISCILKQLCPDILNPSIIFCESVFSDENEFDQLKKLFNSVRTSYQDKNYKLLIDSLDQFNHILVERLFIIEKDSRPSQKYGALLKNESFLSQSFLTVCRVFLEIHEIRNEKFHPKDSKTGKFHSSKESFKDKSKRMKELFNKWLDAISEIVSWYHQRMDNL